MSKREKVLHEKVTMNKGFKTTKMTDAQIMKAMRQKIIDPNLDGFIGALLDEIEKVHGPLNGREYWNGLVTHLLIDACVERANRIDSETHIDGIRLPGEKGN